MKKENKGIVEKYLIKIPMVYYMMFFMFGLMFMWFFSSFGIKDKIIFTGTILFTMFIVTYSIVSYQNKYKEIYNER